MNILTQVTDHVANWFQFADTEAALPASGPTITGIGSTAALAGSAGTATSESFGSTLAAELASWGSDAATLATRAAPAAGAALGTALLWAVPSSLGDPNADPAYQAFVAKPSPGLALPQPIHDNGAWNTWLPTFESGLHVTTSPASAPEGPFATVFPADHFATWTRYENPAVAPDSSPYLSNPHDDWPLLGSIDWDKVGDRLGEGQFKSVHRYGEDQAIGIVRNPASERPGDLVPGSGLLIKELSSLSRLHGLELPAVQASGPWAVGGAGSAGTAGILYEKVYELGSKDIASRDEVLGRMIGARYDTSSALNDNTLDDLLTIRNVVDRRNLAIGDFQVLIDSLGHADIADPNGVYDDDMLYERPDRWYTLKSSTDDHLNALIDATRRSIDLFHK